MRSAPTDAAASPRPARGDVRARRRALTGYVLLLVLATLFPAFGARQGVSSVLPPLRIPVEERGGGAPARSHATTEGDVRRRSRATRAVAVAPAPPPRVRPSPRPRRPLPRSDRLPGPLGPSRVRTRAPPHLV